MDKVRIISTGSKEYSNRRADYFLIEKSSLIHENICALASKLDIDADEFDLDYSEDIGVLVSGNEKHRMTIVETTNDSLCLMIDTDIERQKIMDSIENFFYF